jgi:WD40 repeat protein
MPVNLPFIMITPRNPYPGKVYSRSEWLNRCSIHLLVLFLPVCIAVGLVFSDIVENASANSPAVPKRQHSFPVEPIEILNPSKVVGHGTLNGLDWSADGSQLAIASSLGLYFYDPLNLREINHVDADNWILNVRFSQQMGQLVTLDRDGRITIWNLQNPPYRLFGMILACWLWNVGQPHFS